MTWGSVKVKLEKSTGRVVLGLALVSAVWAQDGEPALSKDHPLVELDLRKFGYEKSSRTGHLHTFIDFTDSNHLAVAWITVDDHTLTRKIGPLLVRPSHLHVVLLDATTGQKVGAQSWPTPSSPVRLLGAGNGEFLTCTGNLLRRISASFEVRRELDLGNNRACHDPNPSNSGWGISPSRRSLLLSSFSGHDYQYTLLDVDTFSVAASWFDKVLIQNISDHWLLGTCGQGRVACIRGLHEAWRPFQPSGNNMGTNASELSTRFVNDDTLVMGWDKKFVLKIGGGELFQIQAAKNRSFEPTVTSDGVDRFALIEDRNRGRAYEVLDMGYLSEDRVVVYSVAEHRAIYAVKVKGNSSWTPWESHRNKLALSPNGALLAVMDGANLEIYRLPDNNPGVDIAK